MDRVRLSQLPLPDRGQRGWPWTEETGSVPAAPPGGGAWPRISIVTPSFNQGNYLEETIRSVLLQGYPNLEFFVIDGGSTDNSVPILRKYQPWLSGWVSERDKGQSDAINKGFARCTGELFNWLCSDDFLQPGALEAVARRFRESPTCDAVAGSCYCLFEGAPERNGVQPCRGDRFDRNPYAFAIWQPSCFFRRSLVARADLVRRDLHYCMDRELWCYLWSRGARWKWCNEVLSVNRFTGANKSVVGKGPILDELDTIYRAYVRERVPLTFWLRHFWLPLVQAHKQSRFLPRRTLSRLLSRSISAGLHAVYSRERVRVLQDEYYMYGMW
jgi:glycosyltransferase involved in cell wall biosynthesis